MKRFLWLLTLSLVATLCAVGLTACEDENGEILIPDTPTHTHAFIETVINPTCTAGGYTLYKCTCGLEYKTDESAALGHNYEWTIITEPTATEKGEETGVCMRCGDTVMRDIPELNHKHNYVMTEVPSTCTENGYRLYKCACGDEYRTIESPILGHNYVSVITAPTCTEQGYTTYACIRCGVNYKEDFTDALGHLYISSTTEPTCNEQGFTAYTCIRCNDTYKGNFVAELGHDYILETTPSTCTEQGYTTYTCSRCSATERQTTPALGHDYVLFLNGVDKDTNKAHFYCKNCQNTIYADMVYDSHFDSTYCASSYDLYTAIVPVIGSTTAIKEIKVYSDSGYPHLIGTYNGEKIKCIAYDLSNPDANRYEYGDEFKYFFENGIIAWNAGAPYNCSWYRLAGFTCCRCNELIWINLSGEHNYVNGSCTVCGKTHTHNYSATVVLPTCTASGYTLYKCSCGNEYKNNYTNALGHNYVKGKCSRCGQDEVTPDEYFSFYLLGDGTYAIKSTNGSNLPKSIVLPSMHEGKNVTEIWSGSFKSCQSLESIIIGNRVTSIGEGAFAWCTSLTSITIPDSVTNIGGSAFYGCSSLTTVTIGNSVTSIGYMAFSYCSKLTSITVDSNNSNYKSIDGNLYRKDGKTLLQYAIGKTATEFTIPDNVTSIGAYAFYNCDTLNKISIPNSVTAIGDEAFQYCHNITSIKLPTNVFLGRESFRECYGLETLIIGNGITWGGHYAFKFCTNLTNIIYEGTKNQWNERNKNSGYWNYDVPATVVHCTDGDVAI